MSQRLVKLIKDVRHALEVIQLVQFNMRRIIAMYGVLVKKGIVSEQEIDQYIIDAGPKHLEKQLLQPEPTRPDEDNRGSG